MNRFEAIYRLMLFALVIFLVASCGYIGKSTASITRVEMKLDVFGVESDLMPTINVIIDFVNDSSFCNRSYYGPALKSPTYKLSKTEIKEVLRLLQTSDLDGLKPNYTTTKSDQPTSITTIYKNDKKYVFRDYGLEGPSPLKDIYKIVFKY